MPHGTLATLVGGLLLAVPAVPAVAQQCASYEPDPRLEAQFGSPALTQADALITANFRLHPHPSGTAYRMDVFPWASFQGPDYPAAPARDYHGQPTPKTLGSGVLVGPNLILTAGHLFNPPVTCPDVRVVFGYGNFTPDQWQMDCTQEPCTVTVPARDVYSCQSVVYSNAAFQDWAVITLDRNVQGRTPLPILRDPPFPPVSTPVTVVGHPNRIPMKVEYSNVKAGCPQCVDAHVLNGSSGSMVVDEASGKVIGIVWGTFDGPVPACDAPYEPEPFYREWFSNPGAAALVTPAWIAAPHIP